MSPPPASDIPDLSELEQAPRSVLVGIIVRQQELIEQLAREVERLKGIIDSDSQSLSTIIKPTCDAVRNQSQQKRGKRICPKPASGKQGDSQGTRGKHARDLDE